MHLSEAEISAEVSSLAAQIKKDYAGKTLLLVGVLKGAYAFTADLMRALDMDIEIDFVRLSKLDDTVILMKDISRDISGKHVLIVDVVIESGKTTRFLYDRLIQSEPASLEIVTLLNQTNARTTQVPVKYSGRTIEDSALIGYGLGIADRSRNLSSIQSV